MAMKWLRKHNKKILVVGGALLMLAFLMPRQRGCGGGPRRKDYAVALAFGHKIMRSEYAAARIELGILAAMGIRVEVADPLDYVLLLREARQMHIPTGSKAVPEELAAQISKVNEVADLAELATRLSQEHKKNGYRVTEKLLRQATGNFWGMIRAEQLVLGRPKMQQQDQGRVVADFRTALGLAQLSEKEMELRFRNVSEKLNIDYVALPAWLYESKVEPADEAEIVKQFEAYKEQYPGTKDNEFGFGYKQRSLVQIEYIKADLNEIKATLEKPSATALAEYYEKHKEFYRLPPEEKPEPDEESQTNDDQKPDSESAPRYKPFEDVYEDLESRWLQEKAQTTVLSMIADARNISRQRWEELGKEQKEDALDLAELYPYASEQGESVVSRLTEEFKVTPDYQRTGWIDISQAERLAGIGTSYTTGPILAFSALAFSVQQDVSDQQKQAANSTVFEVGQDSHVNLIDAEGNAYLFRVIGLQSEKVLSVKEMLQDENVRNKVAADVAFQRAYAYAKQQGQQLMALAEQKGLEKALQEFGEANLQIRQSGMVSRDDPRRALLVLQIPMVDSEGKSQGEVELRWQNLGQFSGSGNSVGILTVAVSNKAKNGKITAIGLNMPYYLRIACPKVRYLGSQAAARSGGEPAPAGPEGYTLRYYGGGINAGQAGRFDLLISAEGQELVDRANLTKGGIEPEKGEVFQLQLVHLGMPLSPIDFLRSTSSRMAGPGGVGFNLAARLERAGKGELLRGVFPANRQSGFVNECFGVLDRPGLLRKPAPAADQETEPEETDEEPAETAARTPELLMEAQTRQPPCTLVELPREGNCYVAAVKEQLPLSEAEFLQNRSVVLNSLMSEQYGILKRQWLNSGNIRKRTGFEEIEPDEAKVEKEQD